MSRLAALHAVCVTHARGNGMLLIGILAVLAWVLALAWLAYVWLVDPGGFRAKVMNARRKANPDNQGLPPILSGYDRSTAVDKTAAYVKPIAISKGARSWRRDGDLSEILSASEHRGPRLSGSRLLDERH